jgi:hypothetical protein
MAAQLIDTSHLRQLDEVITEEARRIHAEHIDGTGDWVTTTASGSRIRGSL